MGSVERFRVTGSGWRTRLLVAPLAALALLAAACGGEDESDTVAEDSLRDCLTEESLTVEANDLGSSASLGSASADFRVISQQGELADVIVEGGEDKAAKTAADVNSAKQSFGAAQTVVVKRKNVVIVFEDQPSDEFRSQVETCVS